MSRALLLENASVLDGAGAPPFVAAVLLEGDRIAAVGDEALARTEHLQHARRADLAGRTLMPGLTDAHCHLSFDAAACTPAACRCCAEASPVFRWFPTATGTTARWKCSGGITA